MRTGVVGNVGGAVEQGVHTVATVSADNGAIMRMGVGRDGVAKIAVGSAGLNCKMRKIVKMGDLTGQVRTHVDGALEAFTSGVEDVLGTRVDLADEIGFVEISVHAVQINRNVEVDDVALLQRTEIGDAVANSLVDRTGKNNQT